MGFELSIICVNEGGIVNFFVFYEMKRFFCCFDRRRILMKKIGFVGVGFMVEVMINGIL